MSCLSMIAEMIFRVTFTKTNFLRNYCNVTVKVISKQYEINNYVCLQYLPFAVDFLKQ